MEVTGVTNDQKRMIDNGNLYKTEAFTPVISSGTVAPVSVPTKVGDIYVDTAAKKIYVAVAADTAADWEILN